MHPPWAVAGTWLFFELAWGGRSREGAGGLGSAGFPWRRLGSQYTHWSGLQIGSGSCNRQSTSGTRPSRRGEGGKSTAFKYNCTCTCTCMRTHISLQMNREYHHSISGSGLQIGWSTLPLFQDALHTVPMPCGTHCIQIHKHVVSKNLDIQCTCTCTYVYNSDHENISTRTCIHKV